MVKRVDGGVQGFHKLVVKYEMLTVKCWACGVVGHTANSCKCKQTTEAHVLDSLPNEEVIMGGKENVRVKEPANQRSVHVQAWKDMSGGEDHSEGETLVVDTNVPTSANKSKNADLERWADVRDDDDKDEIEEGETHPNEMNQPDVPSAGL
ncbi:hypothetical protein NE237_007340 [Protea cynaroides]|uniref:CCHC-type domain-containing protein n=1 Tax=Protea cynaroides TaxID=273540 RepID=A0A9Q0KQ27_9MAGN|nr:hypothetical protein NE237_007340 [Protea cynaroides]